LSATNPLPDQIGGHLFSISKRGAPGYTLHLIIHCNHDTRGFLAVENTVLKPMQSGDRCLKEAQFYEKIFCMSTSRAQIILDLVPFLPQYFGLVDVISEDCTDNILYDIYLIRTH
jgi:hypothetical protein